MSILILTIRNAFSYKSYSFELALSGGRRAIVPTVRAELLGLYN